MLNQKTIDIVKSTVSTLKNHRLEIKTKFYENMFRNNSEVKPLFNMNRPSSREQLFSIQLLITQPKKRYQIK